MYPETRKQLHEQESSPEKCDRCITPGRRAQTFAAGAKDNYKDSGLLKAKTKTTTNERQRQRQRQW